MELNNYDKKTTNIALSNMANKRKPVTPLIKTLFKMESSQTPVQLVKDSATGKILPIGDRANSNDKNGKNTIGKRKRTGVMLTPLHVTAFADIDSDEIKDIPEPSGELMQFEEYTQGEVNTITDHLDGTLEFHAMGALKGAVKDVDGSTAYDLHHLMGTAKVQKDFTVDIMSHEGALDSALMDVKAVIKKKLKNNVIKGYVMLCSHGALKRFGMSKDAKEAFKNAKLKYVVDGFSDGFNYQSIDFVHYEGEIGDTEFLGENEAMLLPIADIYKVVFTPGKGTSMVNKRAQRTYILTKFEDFDTGMTLKGQSNYSIYTEAPDAIIDVTTNFEMPKPAKPAKSS